MASVATQKLNARPFFASAKVKGTPAPFGANWAAAIEVSAVSGIGSHFRVEGSIPRESSEKYHTGFRLPRHTSGMFTRANSLKRISKRSSGSVVGSTSLILPTKNAE